MKNSLRMAKILAYTAVLILAGCGGGSSSPPISVTIQTVSTQNVDQGQTINVTAQVVNDVSNQGVTWTATCSASDCGRFSNLSKLAATYAAPNPVTTALQVTLVAKSAKDPTAQGTRGVTVVAPPSITTTSLPGATGGNSYSATLQEAGGVAPFTWSISAGSLPPGLGLTGDGTVSGTPTAGGNSKFTIQVADSGSPPLIASADLSVNVAILPLTISTTSLPSASVDEAYKQPILVTGGLPPYTWNIQSGALSSWASLNPSTGAISGIPDTTGTSNFTVAVADSEATPLTSSTPLSLTAVSGTEANDSELSGHYAFLFSGFDDATASPLAIAGSFTADGKGKITAGIEDENGPAGPALNVAFNGVYNVDSDHRGAFTIYTPNGSRTFALVLSAISNGLAQNGRFAEFDDTTGTNGQRGAGILRAQDATAFSLGKITGPYAFGLAGHDPSGNNEVIAGSFHADGAGNISTGIADQSIAGTGSNPSLAGTYTVPSSTNGRLAIELNLSGVADLNCSAYAISATELLLVTTRPPSSNELLSGQIESQTSVSFDNSAFNAPAVYSLLGANVAANAAQSTAEIGLLQPDGNGNVTVEYDSQVGPGITKDQNFSSTYAVDASGRGTINGWHAQTGNQPQVFYLVAKNKAFFLDMGHAGLGFLEPQVAAPAGGFSNASLSGALSAATLSPSVSGSPNGTGLVTLDGTGSFTEVTNASTPSGLSVDQTTSGTCSIAAQGRGTVTSISVTTAGIGVSTIALAVLGALLVGWKKPRHNTSRSAFSAFCCLALFATTPAGCRPFVTNQLVFYIIAPNKAVMIHEQSTAFTPDIIILEQ